MLRKCKNCKGTGFVSGIRKRDKEKSKSTLKGKCYYCGGLGKRSKYGGLKDEI